VEEGRSQVNFFFPKKSEQQFFFPRKKANNSGGHRRIFPKTVSLHSQLTVYDGDEVDFSEFHRINDRNSEKSTHSDRIQCKVN